MQTSSSLTRVGLVFLVWTIVMQWGKLLLPFMMWDLMPSPSFAQMAFLMSYGSLCAMVGSLVSGALLDTMGVRPMAIFICIMTAVHIGIVTGTRNLLVYGIALTLRFGNCMPLVCDAYVASAYSRDERGRVQALLWMGVPLGVASVIGPWIAGELFSWFDYNMFHTYGSSAIALVLICLPCVMFVLDEPRTETTRSFANKDARGAYMELLANGRLRKALFYRMLIDVPFYAFDDMSRIYFVHYLIDSPSDMSKIGVLIGMATLITNGLIVPRAMSNLSTQRLLQVGLALLACAYLVLIRADDFNYLAIGLPIQACDPAESPMPTQMVGLSLARATITAQVVSVVDSGDVGKAAALSEATSLLIAAAMPLLSGYVIQQWGFTLVCYVACGIAVSSLGIVQWTGHFMANSTMHFLPSRRD